jgi:hypothetical protein
MFGAIPLLILVVAAYDVWALFAPASLTAPLLTLGLISGATWQLTGGELLVALGLVLLYIEIFKSTRTSSASIIDHVLSLVLFVVCLVEFLVWPAAGTGTFFLIMAMTLIDTVAGFTVTISAARRDFGVNRDIDLDR